MSCCESLRFSNQELPQILEKANMQAFNGDVINMLYCLKAMELMTGKEAADKLRQEIVSFIQNDEVPVHWQV